MGRKALRRPHSGLPPLQLREKGSENVNPILVQKNRNLYLEILVMVFKCLVSHHVINPSEQGVETGAVFER